MKKKGSRNYSEISIQIQFPHLRNQHDILCPCALVGALKIRFIHPKTVMSPKSLLSPKVVKRYECALWGIRDRG